MNPDRSQQISQIYHAALARDERQRPGFLHDACADDEALRREVESLLRHQGDAEAFLATPAVEVAAKVLAGASGPSPLGEQLGSYKILSLLGAGGMGEVYRAHDAKLGRDVALKVLPRELADDPEWRTRLLREARAAASLNHPNICTIHEVGEADGHAYIAMEVVEGQPLSGRLAAGPLPPEEIVRYGLQLADALAHAHDRGVVHRDLKSANVMVTPEGRVKVLDFGLARRVSGEELAEVTTRAHASLSQAGAILGTLPYMAPEQLRAQPADARSDVWALGVVLYEMAAGVRPFEGQTGFELSSAILHETPSPLPSRVPAPLQVVTSRCLEKEPARRYQRASEVRAALEAIQPGAVARTTWRDKLDRRRRLMLAGTSLALVVLVVLAAYFGQLRTRLWSGASASRIESLAVLPLENLSGDAEQEYFADGMTETLITYLAQISTVRVISRTSVIRFKSSHQPLPEIARALGVDAIVEGSVLRAGDRVRISAQLIDARTDRHLWARSFDRDLRDVLVLQSEVAQTIAGEIETRVERGAQERTITARPVDSQAHDAYLRGRYFWNKRTEVDLKLAIDYFEQAIARDPGYALAYAGLADTYESLGFSFDAAVLSPREAMPRARAAALKALELDDASAEAHTSLAFEAFLYEWDPTAAEQHFRRALELNPQYANAHHWYSHYLMARGRIDESLAESRRALELDPLNVLSSTHLGWHYLYAREYNLAIQTLRRAIEMDPSSPSSALPRRFLGFAYQQKGLIGEALAEMEKALEIRKESAEILGELGHMYAAAGRPDRARRILQDLEGKSKTHYTSPYFAAIVYAGLGDRDRAFASLDRAVVDRSDVLVYLGVEPRLDSLRSDPRFQALLRQVNLPGQ